MKSNRREGTSLSEAPGLKVGVGGAVVDYGAVLREGV